MKIPDIFLGRRRITRRRRRAIKDAILARGSPWTSADKDEFNRRLAERALKC